MNKKTKKLYIFGGFSIDAQERILLFDDEIIPLAPKVFETLFLLVEKKGSIVSKEELMDKVWTDSFVEEGNLTQNIYLLRQTFGKENKFIETVPRRGYRFTADINIVEPEDVKSPIPGQNLSTLQNKRGESVFVAKRTRTRIIEEEIIEEDEKLSDITPKALPAHPKNNKSKILIGSIIAFLIFSTIGTIGFLFWQKQNSAPSNALLNNIKFRSLTDTGNLLFIDSSPDGKEMAFVRRNEGNEKSLWLKNLRLNEEVKLNVASSFNFGFLKFSPDGDSIYFRNQKGINQASDIYKTSKLGGNSKLVAEDVWSEFDISSDGQRISFYRKNLTTNNQHLIIKNLATNEEQTIFSQNFPRGFSLMSAPVWTKDEEQIISVTQPQRRFISKIIKINVATGKEESIKTPGIRQIINVVATNKPDEFIVAARERKKHPQIYKININDGDIQRITNDLNMYRKVSLSADNKNLIVLQKITYSHIWYLPEADLTKSKQLTFGKLGRDGRHGLEVLLNGKILFISLEDRNRDLWTISPEDLSKQQLTKDNGDVNDHPFISPDNKFIYFDSVLNGARNIERIDLNGQNLTKITSTPNSNDIHPVISPDGKELYFIRQTKGTSEIWQKQLPDGNEEKIPLAKDIIPDGFLKISPDGKFLAFQQVSNINSTNNLNDAVRTIRVGLFSIEENKSDPKTFVISTNRPILRWTNKSDAFDFIEQTTRGSNIWRQNIFNETEPELILELPRIKVFNFKWSPNNKALVIARGKNQDDAVLVSNFN